MGAFFRLSAHENVYLFAFLNLTMADAVIARWDCKYRYSFWRPITAIREGLTPADPIGCVHVISSPVVILQEAHETKGTQQSPQ